MKRKEIKRTVEEVVRVEYVAEDGQVFRNEEECRKYEESALFVVSKELKRLNVKDISIYDILEEGCEEMMVEIFDVQTDDDLKNLKKYLYLKAMKNGASEKYLENNFVAENENRKDYVFEGVTKGHEVIIWWNYDMDGFWVYGDGSIEGYLSWIRNRIRKFITPETVVE